MKSVFDTMGGTYRQCGDYLIPEISLPKQKPQKMAGQYVLAFPEVPTATQCRAS